MLQPSFSYLSTLKDDKPGVIFCSGTRLHPKPTYYKYYWLVFHEGSPCDGPAFLDYSKGLCTADAMKLIEELKSQGKSCMLYNTSRRRVPSTQTPPWVKDDTYEYAPGFDEDADPLWQGHK
jgi:hypothetical protein